jgi:hypothetical protein
MAMHFQLIMKMPRFIRLKIKFFQTEIYKGVSRCSEVRNVCTHSWSTVFKMPIFAMKSSQVEISSKS